MTQILVEGPSSGALDEDCVIDELRRVLGAHEGPVFFVIGGGGPVDKIVKAFGQEHGVTVQNFPPSWQIGKHAGFERNERMSGVPREGLVAFLSGEKERMTKDLIERCESNGIPTTVVDCSSDG